VPVISKIRNSRAKSDPNWRDEFHLTLSVADGAVARQTAIQSSLRMYKPSVLHTWQVKTFWEEGKVCLEDVEFCR